MYDRIEDDRCDENGLEFEHDPGCKGKICALETVLAEQPDGQKYKTYIDGIDLADKSCHE